MKGSCACGSITVEIPDSLGVGICHCVDCRKSSGGVHAAMFRVAYRDFQVNATRTPSTLKSYTVTGSSGKGVLRYFCGDCGSPIYLATGGKDKFDPDDEMEPFVGLFPPKSIPKPSIHYYTKDREEWDLLTDGAEHLKRDHSS